MKREDFTTADIERFWANVIKTASCWLWAASRPIDYGSFTASFGKVQAHRASYAIANGELSDESSYWCVCHKCDIPGCVNPDHLFVGTHKDNAQDRIAKGRSTKARAPYKPYGQYACEIDGKLYAVVSIRQWDGTFKKKRRRINSPEEALGVARQLLAEFQDPRWRKKIPKGLGTVTIASRSTDAYTLR